MVAISESLRPEGEKTAEYYRVLTFREAMKEVFPGIEGTLVPDIVSSEIGFLRYFGRPEITESAASCLYNPSPEGIQAKKRGENILKKCSLSSGLSPQVMDALGRIKEGPDLDIKFLEEDDQNPVLNLMARAMPSRTPDTSIVKTSEFDQREKDTFSHRNSGLLIEKRILRVPSISPGIPLGMPVLEVRFSQNGQLVLKCHFASYPKGGHYLDDCRYGAATFKKSFFLSAPVIFPDFSDGQTNSAVTPDNIKIGLRSSTLSVLRGSDGFFYSLPYTKRERGDQFVVINPLVFTINFLRMVNQALLTSDEKTIESRGYLDRFAYQECGQIISEIAQVHWDIGQDSTHYGLTPWTLTGESADPARQEIFSLVLLNCLTNPKSFMEIVKDLNLIYLFPAGKEDYKSVRNLAMDISSASEKDFDPKALIEMLNEFYRLFCMNDIEIKRLTVK